MVFINLITRIRTLKSHVYQYDSQMPHRNYLYIKRCKILNNQSNITYKINKKTCNICEVVLLFDESSALHHAEPGTKDSAQREPCFTVGIPLMLRSHKQGFHCDWTDLILEGLRGCLKTSDSSTLAAQHSLVSITFLQK